MPADLLPEQTHVLTIAAGGCHTLLCVLNSSDTMCAPSLNKNDAKVEEPITPAQQPASVPPPVHAVVESPPPAQQTQSPIIPSKQDSSTTPALPPVRAPLHVCLHYLQLPFRCFILSFLSLRLFRQSIPKLARGGDSKLPSRMYFAIALFATLISLFTANWRPLSVAQCPSWSCPALSILWTNPNLAAFSTLPTGAHTPLL